MYQDNSMQIVGYILHQGSLVYQVFRFKASVNSSQLQESAITTSCAMPDTGENHPFYYFQKDDVSPLLGASHTHTHPAFKLCP